MQPFDKIICATNIEPCGFYWLHRRALDQPGNRHTDSSILNKCTPETRSRWFRKLRKAAHIFLKCNDVFCGRTNGFQFFPNWHSALSKIAKSMPLYAKDDCKYWIGLCGLMKVFDDIFPSHRCFTTYNIWRELSEEQHVWMADMFAYLAAARIIELLYSGDSTARKQGLYFRQFSTRIHRDPVGDNICTAHAGLVYFNDYQKNDKCAMLTSINNRGILPLRFSCDKLYIHHPTRKHFSLVHFFSILFGYKISSQHPQLYIYNPDAPLFPDLNKPLIEGKWRRNISAARAQVVRKRIYQRLFPSIPGRFGGHIYRGARIIELLALGVPAVAVAEISRHKNVQSLLHYVATNVLSLIGFSNMMPSNGHDKSQYSGLAWFYANHRLFMPIGQKVLRKLSSKYLPQ